jgi:hypothetical protein
MKKGTFGNFTGFGHQQTSETSGRNMAVELDKIGMNFAYIAINVRTFNRNADFRGNATSLNIKFRIYL